MGAYGAALMPTAIVTGAAGGLGGAVAERLAADGWSLALVDVAQPPALGLALTGSVADEAFAARAVEETVERFGGLDLLVNAAGIGGENHPVVDLPLAELRRVLDVNAVGSFVFAQAAARAMIPRGRGGCIVNFGSIFGQQGVAEGAPYCMSKGAITLLTQSLAVELAPHRIRVNTVSPGNMATEMHWDHLRWLAAERGTSFDAERAAVAASVPLGRHGSGADIAGAVAWLASDDAAYVTGQTIGVNGGVFLT
jgi:NAD(P)-dependent dehydrogenase (short-subunit alcohol dehydrogenase family)